MEIAQTWQRFFQKWPADVPKRGILVTSVNETHPFKGFMLTDELLVLDRTNPDPLGARFVMIGFSAVVTVKLIDALKEDAFEKLGFVGKFAAK